jgi:hypothetical protein
MPTCEQAFKMFISVVVSLRAFQKAYEKDKTEENFIKMKQLEREVDIILNLLNQKKDWI